jgi:hypothetical protein
MAEDRETVGDRDEQVSAEDMRHLMAEAPGAAVPVAPESKLKPDIVEKSAGNVNQTTAVGAAAPSDANLVLPESVSGAKEMKARKDAGAKIAEPKKPNPFQYQDPVMDILNGQRNPDGTFKTGEAQSTNKNGTAGRPTIMDELTLQKLQVAFCMGCTDLEACQFAGISKSTLYNYQNDNPEYLEQKEIWKENPTLKARAAVYSNMGFNADLALKYLERKKKDEFSLRTEHTGKDGGPIETVLDRVESDYDRLGKDAAAALDAASETTGSAPGTPEK